VYQPGDLPKPNSLTCAGGTGYGVQKMKKSLLAAAITLAAVPAFAEIDPIVIYKTSPLGLNDRQTAQAITVITREQIETSGVQSVAEALALAPGVAFNYPASRNNQGKVRLAGAKSEQILVVIDGVALSDGRNGYPDLSVIDLNSVESIELVRGNAAAQLGKGAVAGAVVITTRQAQGNQTEVSGSLGSFNTRSARFSHSKVTKEGVKAFASVYNVNSEGFNVKPADSDTDKDGYEDRGGQVSLSLPTDFGTATFGVNKSSGEYEYDTEGTSDFDNLALNIALESANYTARINFAENEQIKTDNWGTTNYVLEQTQIDVGYLGYSDAIVGLNLLRENTDGSTLSNGKNSDSMSIYGEKLFTTEKANIHLAGRVVDNTNWDTHTAATVSVSGTDQAFSPFVNLGTAFRAPTEFDVNGYDANGNGVQTDPGDIAAADDLDVERSNDLEVGFRARQDAVSVRLGLRISKLQNELKNGSTWSGNSAYNADGETQRYGYDLDVTLRQEQVLHNLSVSRSVRENENGVQQSIFPEYSATYQAETSLAAIDWTLGARYESKRTQQYSESDSYTIARLGASKWINDTLQVSVNVQNLFDRDYQVTDGYQAPRRSTTLTAKYRF
jgi:vitamin B12 transporter